VSAVGSGGRVVLLVDDEEVIRQTGRAMLEELGFEVLVAKDGEEACRIYVDRRDEIDLVMLDLVMPVMDGAATYRRLSQLDPDVNVLFASAYARDSLPGHLSADEIGELLQKPFTIDDLAIALGRALGRKERYSSAS
jgi:CheY-like chemotaxis protein